MLTASAQGVAAPPDSPPATATFIVTTIPGGVVVRNVSPQAITVTLDTPDLAALTNGLCPSPYDYPRTQAGTERFELPTGAATCLAIHPDRRVPLTLHTKRPFHQVYVLALGLPSADSQVVTHLPKNGLTLYAHQTSRPAVACAALDISTPIVSTTGTFARVCLAPHGAYLSAVTALPPGQYSGTLVSASLRAAGDATVPVSLIVRGDLWKAAAWIVAGVLLGLLLPFWQETRRRALRRRAALLEVGVSNSAKRPAAWPYELNRSGQEYYRLAEDWLDPASDTAFAAELQSLEAFSRVAVVLTDLDQTVTRLEKKLLAWSPVLGRPPGVIKALYRVRLGEANALHTNPQSLSSLVARNQAAPLAVTVEEALRLANTVENLDIERYVAQKTPEVERLLHMVYRETFLPSSAEDIKAFRTRLDEAQAAADTGPKGLLPVNPNVPARATGSLGTQAAPDAWLTLTYTQQVGWGLLLALSLIIAVSSGLLNMYVGKPWGATQWDSAKAFLWGAGTGVSLVLASNLITAFSGSALLGALVKRVKL